MHETIPLLLAHALVTSFIVPQTVMRLIALHAVARFVYAVGYTMNQSYRSAGFLVAAVAETSLFSIVFVLALKYFALFTFIPSFLVPVAFT